MRFFLQIILAAALVAGACSAAAQGSAAPAAKSGDAPAATPVDAVPAGSTGRGTLVLAADQKVFKPCGADREFWVNDATGGDLAQVYEKLAGGTGRPLFVDVRGVLEQPPKTGAGSTFPRVLRIVELRRADPAGAGCRENLRYFELRAWGDDPFWRVDVSRNGIIWSSYGAPSSLAFPYGPPRRDGATIRYAVVRDGAERHELELLMQPGRCTDSRTGAVTWLSVEARLNGRALRGCAYEGERTQ
jgi:putative lipoprotein